jgi:hypothetical protein
MLPRFRIRGESTSSGRAHGAGFLAQGAEQPADHLGLAVEVHQALLEGPGEPHPIVELEQLVAREVGGTGAGGSGCAAGGHQVPGWRVGDPGRKIDPK